MSEDVVEWLASDEGHRWQSRFKNVTACEMFTIKEDDCTAYGPDAIKWVCTPYTWSLEYIVPFTADGGWYPDPMTMEY